MGLFGNDDSDPDEEVAELVSAAKGDTVTSDRLTERKAGMMFYNLKKAPIIDFLDDGEQPHFVLRDKLDGLTIEDGTERTTVEMGEMQCAFAVVTDRRVLFLVGTGDDAVHRTSVPYEDAESVDLYEEDELVVRGPERTWELTITSELDDAEVDRAMAFLEREIEGETSSDALEPDAADDEGESDDDAELLFEAEPKQGPTVSVYPDRVVFDKEGGVLSAEKHREFPIETITGVEYKAAGRLDPGYVYFNRKGGSDTDGFLEDMEKMDSSDSVTFRRGQNDEFEELKETVQRLVRDQHGGGSDDGDRSPSPTQSQSQSPVETLKRRFAEGELSKEEYEERLEILQDTS